MSLEDWQVKTEKQDLQLEIFDVVGKRIFTGNQTFFNGQNEVIDNMTSVEWI